MLACPRCGGRLRLIATVEDPDAIRTILAAAVVTGSTVLFFRLAVHGYDPQRGMLRRAPAQAG